MIASALYQPLYLLLVLILTVYIMRQYSTVDYYPHDYEDIKKNKIAVILAVFLILVIGFRPHKGFVDTSNYVESYTPFLGMPFKCSWDVDNFIFDNLYAYFRSLSVPIDYFFLIIAFIYFGGIYVACRKLFPKDILLTFLVYLGAFSTFSYGTNGIKAGVAASIFLLAIAYRDNKWLCVSFLVASLGFHHSMAAPIAVFVMAYFVKDSRYFLFAWILSLVLAALHVTYFQELFAGLTDKQGAGYLSLESHGVRWVSGFRPDFIIYSAIPIFLGNYLMKRFELEDEDYSFMWNLYVGTNAIFLLCTYGTFINRIAYLSWLMYPFILIYPFLKWDIGECQYRYLRYAVYGHLGFTLFMSFVYYA